MRFLLSYMKNLKVYIFTLFTLFLCFLSYPRLEAQVGVEIGGHIGLSHYYGDLNPNYKFSDLSLSAGLKFRRNFNERICIALGLDYGRISGSDSDSFNAFEKKRNLDFKSGVFDTNFTFEFNFFPYLHGTSDYNYTPYIFGGFSLMKFDPKSELDGVTYSLRDLQTEGQDYSLVSGALVYGFGFKWDINRDFSFNVELSGRSIFSDYIDDVRDSYININDPIAAALANRSGDTNFGKLGSQRGDGLDNDKVYFLSIGIVRFFGKLHCPPIYRGQF